MSHNLILPPGFELFSLREGKRAHEEAVKRASEVGAASLFWVRRFDVAEFALVIEPNAPLNQARRAFYIGMNALADTISSLAPPERPVSFRYPDCLFFDYGLIGGGRLSHAPCEEHETPEWMVFSGMVRLAYVGIQEEGTVAQSSILETAEGEAIDASLFVETFTRHFLYGVNLFLKEGFKLIGQNYLARLERDGDKNTWGIDSNGDLLKKSLAPLSLIEGLKKEEWYDARNGLPKI